jgi:hypothetical protein
MDTSAGIEEEYHHKNNRVSSNPNAIFLECLLYYKFLVKTGSQLVIYVLHKSSVLKSQVYVNDLSSWT